MNSKERQISVSFVHMHILVARAHWVKDVSFFRFRGFGYKMGFCEGCFIKHSSLKYMFRRSASLVVKFMSKCEIGVVSTQVTYIAAVIVIWEASMCSHSIT